MKSFHIPGDHRGFSLIEVLIAVVVLSIGLLALASLQANLIRSSADSKSQTVALALAKESLEQRRTFTDMTDYDALTDIAEGSAATVTSGGIDFSLWQDVERYAWHSADEEFKLLATDTGALPAGYVRNNEFKIVRMHAGWTDATGAARTVVLEDAISAIPPENSARIARKRMDASNRKPRVIINDPSLEDGVIPIAIGDDSETAATNPRPTVVGNQGTPIRETNFDIYTYSALNDGTATAQARVETSIVGCRCSTGDADASDVAYRPAFWNGTRYETPEEAPYTSPAGELMEGNKPAVVQSDLCTACCRDHHDSVSGTLGAKFSPRRASHTHFDGLTQSNVVYDEACRLIRVDGFMRVAPDIYNEHLNLLKTAAEFTLPAPDSTAITLYQDFVIDYLDTQFTSRASGYNTSLSNTDAELLAAPLESAPIELEQFEERWLHSRGLYVDYLETDAINAVNNAKSNCADGLTPSECVLRVLPFTSINLAEVAGWSPSSGDVLDENGDVLNDFDVLSVTEANFVESIEEGVPVRGKVLTKAPGTTLASSSIRPVNTGLLGDVGYFVNPDEQTPERVDQEFVVEGPSCGNSYSGTIASKGTMTSQSAEVCEAALQGYATTKIQLNLALTSSQSSNTTVSLVGPDGTSYPVDMAQAIQVFTPTSDPAIASGHWKLVVTNSHNGQAANVSFNWSVAYISGGVYTINWFLAEGTVYPFSGNPASTGPGASASPAAVCNPTPGTGNPYTCSSVSVDTQSTVTFAQYNYEVSQDATTVSCAKPNGKDPVSFTCAVPVCRNFTVASAQTAAVTGSLGQVLNDGKATETTSFTFSNLAAGDSIEVVLSEGVPTLPAACSYPQNATSPTCAQVTWGNPCN